jgi:DNA repair exonuclease SbcCD ATPase subunit
MLSAQAKESAADAEHKKAIQEKEDRIEELEKKIKEIENELAAAKKMVEKLENDIARRAEEATRDKEQINQLRTHRRGRTPDSPIHTRKISSPGPAGPPPPPPPDGLPLDYASPEILAEHRAKVAILEEELEEERKLRREADGEIIKLRAAINGVKLNEDDVNALLAPQLGANMGLSEAVSEESSIADEEMKRYVLSLRVAFPVPSRTIYFLVFQATCSEWCGCHLCPA